MFNFGGFTLDDLEQTIESVRNSPPRDWAVIMGWRLAWDVTGRKVKLKTKRRNGKLYITSKPHIPT